MCGSLYRTGAPNDEPEACLDDEPEACLDRDSLTVGSVVERGKGGGDNNGGVLLLEDRGNTALLGSVVRLDVGGWNGVMAGVEEDWGTAGVPTVARELVGLPLLGRSKPRLWGELGLETTLMALVLACRLMRNCSRTSSLLLC